MKKLLLLSMLLFLFTIAFADVYPIGTLGTSSSATYGPFSGLYDFGWTKTIVTAAEITAAGYDGTDDIVGVGYYVGNTPSNYEMLDLHMFVRHTALTTYTTTADETGTAMPDSSTFTQVFSGNLTFNGGGWYYITFNLTNFNWDGTSNIEIFWKNWDGDYVTGYPTWRYITQTPDYKLVYKQADTTFPTTAGTRSLLRSNLALVTPQLDPPNPAVLVYPADAGWAFLDGVLSWQDGGGMPTGYDVYLDTVDGTTLVSDDQTGTTYTPTLAAGTTYYWKVVPYNINGPAVGVTTWSFKTPTVDQIAESFDAVDFPPLGWTTPGGAFTRSTVTPFYGVASAYEFIAAGPSYLHTTMLELTATSELDWWMRTSSTTGIGRVQIVYSSDGTTWSNIGAEIIMPTETTWMNYNVDLSSLAGNNYMIGFMVYSSTTSSTSFYIDHVVGPEIAALVPDPATVVYPTDAGWAFLDGTLSWSAAASGGIPDGYDVYFDDVDGSTLVSDNQLETTYVPTLAAGTTYYWKVIPYNASGPALNCPVWSFKTPTATQLAESFDATTFPPAGWTNVSSAFTRSTTTPFHGVASAYEYISTGPSILYTPMLAIDANSALDWWMRTTTTTGIGRVQINYSTDGVTWSPVGAEIIMPSETTWQNYNVDLSTITAGNYFISFHVYSSTTTSTSFYIDHVFGPEYAAIAPGPIALTAPANLAVDVSEYPTFSWSGPTTGGMPTGYRLYCDTSANPTTLLADVPDLSYTATTALNYSTLYYWKVVAYNGTGDSPDSEIYSFTTRDNPIISTFPWLEDFGTGGDPFPPLNWALYSGLMVDPIELTTATSYWYQDDFANVVTDPSNESGRINIYGTTRKGWMVSPPIQMPGVGYNLEFDIALTDYVNAAPPDDPAGLSGIDDKFAVLIGDGVNWTTANAVKIWDNDDLTNGGIYEVYNSVSHTGDHWVLPLDSYTGIKYIAFYGESTVSNADNDFFVDNVRIRLGGQAPEHVTLVAPADLATDVSPFETILQWTNAVGGGAPSYYEVYVGASPIDPGNDYYGEYFYETTSTSLNLTEQVDIVVGFATTWYWAVLPYNDSGNPDPTGMTVYRFTTLPDPTIIALPYAEYFDSVTAPTLPYGWSSYVNSTSTYAVVATYSSTTYAETPPNSARLYNSADAMADLRLITPMIDATIPLNTIKLKFFARGLATGDNVLIGTVDVPDGTGVFTLIDSLALTTTRTEYTYSLDSYVGTDQYLCFKLGTGETYNYAYIDNVQLIELLPIDLAALSVTGPTILEAGTPYDFVVSVFNEGTAEQSAYTVNLKAGTTVLATLNVTTPLAAGATVQHTLSWTPATGGVFQLFGEVVVIGDGNLANNETPTMEVYVLDNTMTVIPVGDDATTTSGYYLPLTMYYKNSVSEELYFTDEMHLQSGTITAIVYKNTFLNDLPNKPVKIWMAHTTVTDLTGGWLPAIDYTLVFDGTVNFPSGVNYIVIPLQTPFVYTGGTLATRVNRPMDTVYHSTSDKFYYTTNPDHTTRSRYIYSDTVTYDPLAPSATGTTLNYFPNTTFVVQNAVLAPQAILSGHVYEFGTTTPIEGALITLTERATALTDQFGYYEFIYWDSTYVDLTASKTNYYSSTVTDISFEPGIPAIQDFYLTPYPQITFSGMVTSNDYPTGLEGATVQLLGYANYETTTGAGGTFSIPGVYGTVDGLIYTVTASKDGYQSFSGEMTAYSADLNYGTINLIEYLWTPYNLVATHEGDNARLVWDPAAAPDYYFTDFETDNGGWVGSGVGDWEWTNTYNVALYNPSGSTYTQTPPDLAYSGTGMWGTIMYGPYSNSGAFSYLTQTFDLSGFDTPQLRFWRWNNLNGTYDYYQVIVNGTVVFTENVVNNTWMEKVVDLTAYAGMSSVEIQFAEFASTVVNYAGLYIDDIYIGNPPARTAEGERWFLYYDVYRFLAADEGNPGVWTQLQSGVADTTYLDTGFSALPGGTYEWAIKAVYSGDEQSEAIISNTLGILATPLNITATKVGANVQLDWTADPGAGFYRIYGSDDPYTGFVYIGYSTTNTYTITAPADMKKFYYVTAGADEEPVPPTPPAIRR